MGIYGLMIGNNTHKRTLRNGKMTALIIIMLVLGLNIFCIIANAENPNTSTHIFIESRFKLWDSNEKMIDENFQIHIVYTNISHNNTFSYYIQINNEIYNGTTNYYYFLDIHLNNGENINTLLIKINNETALHETNIKIIGGVSGSGIKRSIEPFTISLSPFQWNLAERNIFYSVIIGAIISIFFGFRIVKFYRAKNGIHIIDG